jgi:hypothetical protein
MRELSSFRRSQSDGIRADAVLYNTAIAVAETETNGRFLQ